jgi:hypothetical protein
MEIGAIVEAGGASYFPPMGLNVGKILDSAPNVKKDGTTYHIPEEVDATLFVALGQEVLQLPRVSRVDPGVEVVRVATHKGETFFFPGENLVGVKFATPEKAHRSGAGFGK